MKNLTNKDSSVKNHEIYIYSILVVLIFFGSFFRMDFSTDTYSVIFSDYVGISKSWGNLGRPILGLWWYIISFLNFSTKLKYMSSFVLAIVATVFSITKLYKIIQENFENKKLALLISIMIIINPFTIEYFLFIEKGIMMLSVLFAILAAEKFINFIKYRKKKNILLTFVFLLLSMFCYQSSLALFLVICCIYIVKNSKQVKDFIIDNLILALTYGLTLIIGFLSVTSKSRVGGERILSVTIKRTLSGIKSMFLTYNILPRYITFMLFAIIFILFVIILINNKDKIKTKIYNIFSFFYISIVLFVAAILPVIAQSSKAIWFVARTTFSFGAIFGILFFYLVMINKKNKYINYFIEIFILGILFIQFYKFNYIIIDHYNTNYRDKVNAIEINNSIKKYEEENNTKINKIGFCLVGDTGSYEDIFTTGNINESVYHQLYSDSVCNIINYYTNSNFKRIDLDNEKIKELKAETSENIIFEDDIAYVKIYFNNKKEY